MEAYEPVGRPVGRLADARKGAAHRVLPGMQAHARLHVPQLAEVIRRPRQQLCAINCALDKSV
jgi:hypothetical protein